MSLVGHWTLDDGSGPTAADGSGNGHNGTLVGSPTWTASGLGGALALDGTDDLVTIPSSADLRITGDITIALWMRKAAEAADWARLVGKGESDHRSYGIWEEYDGKRILWQGYDMDAWPRYQFQLFSASSIELDTWAHVCCVCDGSSALIYIDGELDASGAKTGTPPATDDPVTIGHAGYFAFFNGTIDDVRIYNHALSAGEVSTLFSAGSP